MLLGQILFVMAIYGSAFSSSASDGDSGPSLSTQEPPTKDDDSTSWDYEPRVWASDDESSIDYSTDDNIDDGNAWQEPNTSGSFRGTSNFLGNKDNLMPKLKADEKCTQFRADIREAVVCDKKRCDKFDFEWPTYDNQIALIETTKHGMRFHRTDLAFANGDIKRKDSSDTNKELPFDVILSFIKPKPTTTTRAPHTRAPSATTTTVPAKTSSSTPASQLEPTTQATADVTAQDSNTTQLITTYRLDTSRKKQSIIGFGGALSDAACRNIKSLSPQMSRSLMEDYYGERGLRYNIARMSMGSSDFSSTPYTNNDLENGTYRLGGSELGDVEMRNFRLVSEDYEYKLPVARQAIATSKQELKFFSSLWSPPVWMKNNSHIVHGYLKGDVYGPYYKALAEYMLRWLEAYRKNGIEMWATTGLNEPVTGVMPFIFHNSLGMTRDDYVIFNKLHLGPMLRQRGFANVKLMMLDDNKGYAPKYVTAMLEDQTASQYISGVAVHWYMNDEYENLNFISKKYPDKFILASEACNGYLPFQVHVLPGNWDRGVAYMYDIIRMIQKNSVGWVDWNVALDLTGGPNWADNKVDAPIIVNAKRDEYYKSPMFYALGHFSRFVEPNSTRLDYRLANARFEYPLEAVAFLTPKNYIVIVALNSNRHIVPFKIIVDRRTVRIITLRAESFSTIIFRWKKTAVKTHAVE